ncbi:MAG TPA: IS4 family transposase [Acidobacteriaceae bacterium]|nr:IS4 family transposase [Acidobacteriaceae bacterium]
MFGMNLPHPRCVLELLEKLGENSDLWSSLRPEGPAFSRRRIYTLGVVIRLMILQRLLAGGTLGEAIQHWLESQPESERKTPISPCAGAYCRARQKLPKLVAINVFAFIVERLRGWLPANPVLPDRPVFVLDGTTLTLPHTDELLQAYPPSRNQHGESHWPMIRLVVLQDVQTGVALRPHWGPHHGAQAVGEQELALQAIPELPEQAVVLGDRNFGVFAIAWAAAQHRREVLVRLTKQRAEALAGEALARPCQRNVCWKPTRFDRCGGPFPEHAAVAGRLVCIVAEHSGEEQLLYFFTTLDLPPEALGALYRLRWNVETDLRSIKQTVRLQQLTARSLNMLEKELLIALAAYNLVRAVICLAAEKIHVEPRRLSFTSVYTLVETFLPDILAARTPKEWNDCWERIISIATAYRLPQRGKPRSYPRATWHRPSRHSRT